MAPSDPAPADPPAADPLPGDHRSALVGSGPDAVIEVDRVLTIPNLITFARLGLLPVYLWLLIGQDNRAAAATLLAVLGATDWVDGYVARHFDQASKLGRILDPIADRLLFFVGIGGILAVDGAPRWFAVVVLVREITVATITVTLTLSGVKPVHVTWFGKAGTFGLMFSFPLFLGGTTDLAVAPALTALGYLTGIPGLALSLYAAVLYVPRWREAIAEAREERATGAG